MKKCDCDCTHGMGMHVRRAFYNTCDFAHVGWRAVLDVITRVGDTCLLTRYHV